MKKLYQTLKTTRAALMVLLMGIFLLITNTALSQTVTTDKGDYSPGDVVEISGSGFTANEMITILVEHLVFMEHESEIIYAEADTSGKFFTDEYVISIFDVGEEFRVNATDESGLTAETYFTDGTVHATSENDVNYTMYYEIFEASGCKGTSYNPIAVPVESKEGDWTIITDQLTPNNSIRITPSVTGSDNYEEYTFTTWIKSNNVDKDGFININPSTEKSVSRSFCQPGNNANRYFRATYTQCDILPVALIITGSPGCDGGKGTITSTTSELGVMYQLFDYQGYEIGEPVAGTGNGLTWLNITISEDYYYVVGYFESTGCQTESNQVTVDSYIAPTATLSGTTTICEGDNATLTITFTGSPDWNIVYTDGTNQSSIPNINNTTYTYELHVNPTTTTTYSLISVDNGNGCSGSVSGSATVTVNPLPTAAAITGPDEVCYGSTIDLTEGTTGTINWFSTNTSVATVDANGTVTPVAAAGGTTDITYTVTDGNGCTSLSSAAHTVTVNPLPDCSIKVSSDYYFNDATPGVIGIGVLSIVTFCAPEQENMTYVWSGISPTYGEILTEDQKNERCITVNDPGTYEVIITDANGCSSTCSIVLKYLPGAATRSLTGEETVCPGSTNDYGIEGVNLPTGFTFSWSLENNDGGASISGLANLSTVSVIAGTCNSSYKVHLDILNATNHVVVEGDKTVAVGDDTAPYLEDDQIGPSTLNQTNITLNNGDFDPEVTAVGSQEETLIQLVKALYADNCDNDLTVTVDEGTATQENSDCSWAYDFEFSIEDDCENVTTGVVNVSGGDRTPPELENVAFTANDVAMVDNTLTLNCSDAETDFLVQFDGTSSSEPLASQYFGLYLTGASEETVAELEAYYASKPEPWKSYLVDAANGTKPFAYIKGSTLELVDAAQHDLVPTDVDMTIPGDFPFGTYTVSGTIVDLSGCETTVQFTLVVDGDRTPPELENVAFTANDVAMVDNTLTLNCSDAETDFLVQFDGTSSSEPLASQYFGLYLTGASEETVAELEAYYASKPEPWKSYLVDAANGTKPFAYIKGSTLELVDAAQHDLVPTDVDMTIPGDFPFGTYTVSGTIVDLSGCETTVQFTLVVDGDRTPPEVSNITLKITDASIEDWFEVDGDFPDFEQCLDSDIPYYNLDVAQLTSSVALEPNVLNEFRLTSIPAGFWEYWNAKGIDKNTPVLGDILSGIDPIFSLKYTGTDYVLIDGFLGENNLFRINGDYPEGEYTVTGTVIGVNGCISEEFDVKITIKQIPKIVTQPVSVLTCMGSSATFSVVGFGTDLHYQWYKVLEGDVDIAIPGATSSTLTIDPIETTDAGDYYVILNGTCSPSVTSNTAKLMVKSVMVDPITQQYSDQVKFTARIYNGKNLLGANTSASVTFKISDINVDGAVNIPLIVVEGTNDLIAEKTRPLLEVPSYPSNGQMSPGSKEVKAVFNNITNSSTCNPTTSLTITQEDAIVDYIGIQIVGEANQDVNTTPVTLRATITDNYIDDTNRGDIRNARVMFMVDGNAVSGWLTPDLVSPADLTQGIVSVDWNAPVPKEGYTDYTVEVKVDGYYKGSAESDDQTVLTVYRTSLNEFITGGGHIIPIDSKGEYASDPGRKVNFGFNIKWNKTMKNLQGRMNIIFRRGDQVYQIKTTAMSGLGINPDNPCEHQAVFTSKANLSNVTKSDYPIDVYGGLQMQVTLTDNGEPGVADMIGITVYNGSDLIYSSSWPISSTEELTLVGGNIIVHDGLICNESDITHTVITSSKNPSFEGDVVKFTATVYGHDETPQGIIQFMVDGDPILFGTDPVVDFTYLDSKGTAVLSVPNLEASNHEITAQYTSTNGYKSSEGSLTQLVLPGTTILLTSSKNPSVEEEEVTFWATVKGPGPNPMTGEVVFKINGVEQIPAVDLNGFGVAELKHTFNVNGQFDVVATYDDKSDTLTQVVNELSVTLESSENPSVAGQVEDVVFTAKIAAEGSITFKDGNTVLGTKDLTSGEATWATSFSLAGTHVITAIHNNTGLSATLNQVVINPSVVLYSSVNPSASDDEVTFTASVNGGVDGIVTFTIEKDEVTVEQLEVPLSSGTAHYPFTFPTEGSYLVTAVYDGNGSTASLIQVVKDVITVTLTSSNSTSTLGENVTFTATVTGSSAPPSGTITFREITGEGEDAVEVILAVLPVSGDKAQLNTNDLTVGEHTITATYDLTGAVGSCTQTVESDLTITLVSSKNPEQYDKPVTFIATVTGSGVTIGDEITFMSDGDEIGTGDIQANGSAEITNIFGSTGSYTITATYGGVSASMVQQIKNKVKSAQITTDLEEFGVVQPELKVYPNPFSEQVKFEFVSPIATQAKIDVYDMTGRMVQTIFDDFVEVNTKYNAEFKPEVEVSGMYFYRMQLGDSIYNGKLIYKEK